MFVSTSRTSLFTWYERQASMKVTGDCPSVVKTEK